MEIWQEVLHKAKPVGVENLPSGMKSTRRRASMLMRSELLSVRSGKAASGSSQSFI